MAEKCPKCSSPLIFNERLTKRYVETTGLQVSIYYCGSCVDEIYFLHHERLFPSKEWKARAASIIKE